MVYKVNIFNMNIGWLKGKIISNMSAQLSIQHENWSIKRENKIS
jgi:hypothetical protein